MLCEHLAKGVGELLVALVDASAVERRTRLHDAEVDVDDSGSRSNPSGYSGHERQITAGAREGLGRDRHVHNLDLAAQGGYEAPP